MMYCVLVCAGGNVDGVDGSDAAILQAILMGDPNGRKDASDDDELRDTEPRGLLT
jgi:hypothetical protein